MIHSGRDALSANKECVKYVRVYVIELRKEKISLIAINNKIKFDKWLCGKRERNMQDLKLLA